MVVNYSNSNVSMRDDAEIQLNRRIKSVSTFVCELIESSKCIDLVIVAIRHGCIDQTRRNIALGFADDGAIISATTATSSWTGRHEVRALWFLMN
jgi:hypothetical protein